MKASRLGWIGKTRVNYQQTVVIISIIYGGNELLFEIVFRHVYQIPPFPASLVFARLDEGDGNPGSSTGLACGLLQRELIR